MGGDFGPRVTVVATLDILRQQPRLKVVLFGDSHKIQPILDACDDTFPGRLHVQHCDQAVAMDEKPSSALRNKRQSSMWCAVQWVAEGKARACVSAGNTGALMAISLYQLGALPGISRPAICTRVPTSRGSTYLLDLGANLECSARQLYEFALMSSLAAASPSNPKPSVGLLNIGVESIKGRQEILDAAALLKADADINYMGFVEGDALFTGVADIVVCDGFSGNVALKTGEGVAKMIQGLLRQTLSESLLARVGALLARPSLKRMLKKVDPAQYNGASLLGLRGVVVKSHGAASEWAFLRAIEVALGEVERDLPTLIAGRLADKNNQSEVIDEK